jgi:FKBP-type peptidyl-prolyl cis-trans isomerase
MKFFKSFFLLSLVFSLASCLKDEYQAQLLDNESEIQNYVTSKNLTVQKSPEGMYYQITSGGQSAKAKTSDLIEYYYKLTLLDGGVIDSSQTSKGQVRSLIFGGFNGSIYNLPLSYLNAGDKGIFLLPSNLAYGGNSTDLYKAYSCFRVDAQVVKILTQAQLLERMKLENNMMDAKTTTSGLIYKKIVEKPSGKKLDYGYAGKFNYLGKFGFNYNHYDAATNGIVYNAVFDKGTGINLALNAGSFIKGFEEALKLMNEGEKMQIILPYDLAYGVSGNSSIPGYCPLYFELEVTAP